MWPSPIETSATLTASPSGHGDGDQPDGQRCRSVVRAPRAAERDRGDGIGTRALNGAVATRYRWALRDSNPCPSPCKASVPSHPLPHVSHLRVRSSCETRRPCRDALRLVMGGTAGGTASARFMRAAATWERMVSQASPQSRGGLCGSQGEVWVEPVRVPGGLGPPADAHDDANH